MAEQKGNRKTKSIKTEQAQMNFMNIETYLQYKIVREKFPSFFKRVVLIVNVHTFSHYCCIA